MRQFLKIVRALPWDAEAADFYADIRHQLVARRHAQAQEGREHRARAQRIAPSRREVKFVLDANVALAWFLSDENAEAIEYGVRERRAQARAPGDRVCRGALRMA